MPLSETRTCARHEVSAAPRTCINGIAQKHATGRGALNQDGSINSDSNPAKVGSVVSIFATGRGSLLPAPADGAILDAPLPTQTLPAAPAGIIGGIGFPPIPISPNTLGQRRSK
jgi:uncharacterized protein (TIGR03437 family)